MKVGAFFRRLGRRFVDHKIDDISAMMAYYAVLALFPMVVFVVTLALLVLPGVVIDDGIGLITSAMPSRAGVLFQGQAERMLASVGAGFAIGSATLALWGASRGASALILVFNQMYGKTEERSWWRRQWVAISVTLGVALLLVAALTLLVAGPAIARWVGWGKSFDEVWAWTRWAGSGVLVMMVWAILYKFLPNTHAPFRIFTPGAVVGVLLWLGISRLFGLYLENFGSYDATYGALGGAVIFLTWLWLSNMALLLGAEINVVLAELRRRRSDAARQLADHGEHLLPQN